MADNIGYTPGSGVSVATDDVAGVHYEKVKLFSSTADSTTAVSDNNGVYSHGPVAHDAVHAGNPLSVGGKAASTAPSAVAAADAVLAFFDLAGRLIIAAKANTASLTTQAASATSVTVLASNAARLGATVLNDGNADLYLKFGATASTTDFTVKIPPNGYYEVPFGYTGILDGIWSAASGTARVTELT